MKHAVAVRIFLCCGLRTCFRISRLNTARHSLNCRRYVLLDLSQLIDLEGTLVEAADFHYDESTSPEGYIGAIFVSTYASHFTPFLIKVSRNRATPRNILSSSGDKPSGSKCMTSFRIFLTVSRCSTNCPRSTARFSISQCCDFPKESTVSAKSQVCRTGNVSLAFTLGR